MKKPKIGILTHFNSFQDGYALHVGWLERVKMLKRYDQDFDILVNSNCNYQYPNGRKVLPNVSSGEDFNRRVSIFEECYLKELGGYDIIITADIMYQKGGNFLAMNQALRNAAPKLKARYIHWIHSAWIEKPKSISYPESLRFLSMPNSEYVYMNNTDAEGICNMYGVPPDKVKCVYNTKDYRSFHNFHPLSIKISDWLDFQNRDIIQVLPVCSTRMDAKGIDTTARLFGLLKKRGKRVALVIANSHSKEMGPTIDFKKRLWKDNYNLIDGVDYVFTSQFNLTEPCPRAVVSDLFKVSNVFIFASLRENSPNVLLEAKISGNLLALNRNNKCLEEFGGKDAIYFSSSYKVPGVSDGEGDTVHVAVESEVVDKIISRARDNSFMWEYSFDNIWCNQMKKLLYKD